MPTIAHKTENVKNVEVKTAVGFIRRSSELTCRWKKGAAWKNGKAIQKLITARFAFSTRPRNSWHLKLTSC